MGECKGCEKLNGQVAKLVSEAEKLETKLAAAEGNLEKALDDLAEAGTARDEAVRKANRIAKDLEKAGASSGGDGDGSGEGGGGGNAEDKRGFWTKVWAFPW